MGSLKNSILQLEWSLLKEHTEWRPREPRLSAVGKSWSAPHHLASLVMRVEPGGWSLERWVRRGLESRQSVSLMAEAAEGKVGELTLKDFSH